MEHEKVANVLAGTSGSGIVVSLTAALPMVQLVAALVAIATGILAARYYIMSTPRAK